MTPLKIKLARNIMNSTKVQLDIYTGDHGEYLSCSGEDFKCESCKVNQLCKKVFDNGVSFNTKEISELKIYFPEYFI